MKSPYELYLEDRQAGDVPWIISSKRKERLKRAGYDFYKIKSEFNKIFEEQHPIVKKED